MAGGILIILLALACAFMLLPQRHALTRPLAAGIAAIYDFTGRYAPQLELRQPDGGFTAGAAECRAVELVNRGWGSADRLVVALPPGFSFCTGNEGPSCGAVLPGGSSCRIWLQAERRVETAPPVLAIRNRDATVLDAELSVQIQPKPPRRSCVGERGCSPRTAIPSALRAALGDESPLAWHRAGVPLADAALLTDWQDGRANLQRIGTARRHMRAVHACPDKGERDEQGRSLWYLPALEELRQLYDQRFRIGGFVTRTADADSAWYWSSTEDGSDLNRAWAINFATGTVATAPKAQVLRVRCVTREELRRAGALPMTSNDG